MDTPSLLSSIFSGLAVFIAIGGAVVSSAKYQEKVDNANEKLKDVDAKIAEKFTAIESKIAENKAQFNTDLNAIKSEYKELKDSSEQRQNLYIEKFTRLEITMDNILHVIQDLKEHLKK